MKRTEYIEAWESHVKDFSRLGWNLPDRVDRDRVKELQAELMVLVNKASCGVKEE